MKRRTDEWRKVRLVVLELVGLAVSMGCTPCAGDQHSQVVWAQAEARGVYQSPLAAVIVEALHVADRPSLILQIAGGTGSGGGVWGYFIRR